MRARLTTAAAVLMLCAPFGAHDSMASQRTAAVSGRQDIGSVPSTLVGTWTSEPYRMPLVTELERSVWGADSISERTTELEIDPSGDSRLTVTRSIVDAKGRALGASVSIESVEMRVGEGKAGTAGRIEHAVEVVSAERRYPDDPDYRWPLEGVRVRVVGFDDDQSRIEIRFDTPEGRGSFWQMLRREGDR